MGRLGRMIAAAAVALTLAMPGAAAAQEASERPLADLPDDLAPAVRAIAQEFGLSYEQLVNASDEQLEEVLCAEVDAVSPKQIATQAGAALDDADSTLSDAERERLIAQLPAIIADLEAEYCTTATTTAEERGQASGDGADGSNDDAAATNDDDASGAGDGDGDGSSGDDAGAQDGADAGATNEDGIPLPTRVDTGAGGPTDADRAAPLAFGALFAVFFGMVGVGVTRRQTD